MRRISLHPDEPLLLVRSEYNDRIRLAIKSFSGARWDGKRRVWQLPLEHKDELLEQLEPFQFDVDPNVRDAEPPAQRSIFGLAGTTSPASTPSDDDGGAGDPSDDPASDPTDDTEIDPTLTVRQVNLRIGGALLRGFPESIWVRGEIAGYDKGARRKHWYFELIEKSARGDDVAARLPVVVFSSRRQRIERRLARAAEPLALRDGLEVRVRGRIEYYSPGGRLQLIVDDINPDFAFGQLARRRKEILAQIQAAGLAGLNAALPWPALPLRVGLITAADSDALHDVIDTFAQTPWGFRIAHLPAAVQGAQLEPEVLAALRAFEQAAHAVDIVLIVRGGGARSDLAWFDNLAIAEAVARHPVKIVLGIGHERDRSVLAAVAHAEKTPTAAAELVVGIVAYAEEQLDRCARQLAVHTRRRLTLERERNHRHAARLLAAARSSLQHARRHVEGRLAPGMRVATRSRLSVERNRLTGVARRLQPQRFRRSLGREQAHLAAQRRRLVHASRSLLTNLRRQLELARAHLGAVDPKQALARGFAILQNQAGEVVKKPADAPIGSRVTAIVHGGRLVAEVQEHLAAQPTASTDEATTTEEDAT